MSERTRELGEDDGPDTSEPIWTSARPSNGRVRQAAEDATLGENTYLTGLREFLGDDEPTEDDSEDWVIRGLVPASSPSTMCGAPKSGKSMLLTHAAICVAAGLDWLGQFPVRRARALLILREDTLREDRRRIWRLARGLGLDPRELAPSLVVNATAPFYFDEPKDVDRMRRTLDTWRPELVVIDSLSRTHRRDENSVREMQAVTNTWADLCCTYHTAITTIHHVNGKGAPGDARGPGDRMRGTSDLFALVRQVALVEKKTPVLRTLRTEGNLQFQPEPFAVAVEDLEECGKKVIRISHAGSAEDAADRELDKRILAALNEGPCTARQLREKVGGTGAKVDRRALALEDTGEIYRTGKGPWTRVRV